MGFLKNRREKRRLEQILEDVQSSPVQKPEQASGKRQAGSYVLDRCEQILESAREIDDSKKEYRIITSYLNDIEIIENLSEDRAEEIHKAAENVTKLNHTRDQFLNTSRKISDAQYQMIQQHEDEIPDVVKRMRENENYQATVKRDMQYLAGEKQELMIRKRECRKYLKLFRQASYFLMAAAVTLAVVLLVLNLGWQLDTRYVWLGTIAAAVIGAAVILLGQYRTRRELRQIDVNVNYAIELENKVKIKYVNITNAVDYTCEKYHVRDSRELSYQWDMYQEAVREQEKYRQTNEDLKYYYDRLVSLLQKCSLYDSRVWIEQPRALIEPREMVEIKHNLLVRRQKLRSKIAYNLEMVKKDRKEIETMLKTHPEDSTQIRDMLSNIDKMAGLAG